MCIKIATNFLKQLKFANLIFHPLRSKKHKIPHTTISFMFEHLVYFPYITKITTKKVKYKTKKLDAATIFL